MDEKIGIFWLREDFRILKNYALAKATKNHKKVSALYIYKEEKFKDKSAQRWWVFKSLQDFKVKLNKYNIKLEIVKTQNYEEFFKRLLKKNDFSIYWNKIYEPDYLKFDKYLSDKLSKNNINYEIFKGNILNEFNDIKKKDNTAFKVFTPFWRHAEQFFLQRVPSSDRNVSKCENKISYFSQTINEQAILPKKDWFKKFNYIWKPSENEGLLNLKSFLRDRIEKYPDQRNFPNIVGTSKLSPYIKHGQLHVETIWFETMKIKEKKYGKSKFLAEIGWREFGHSLINNFPHMLKGNYSNKFDKFPWKKNIKFLNAWKKGITGYPIVDAGMRELDQTGWMHNRVRMIVGSFLVKHLLIHWREGEKHFRDTLLDFSEANNVSGWQWVAGCGADAAPYFRIFNPILQGEKFDKNGEYVKRWVPEIKNLPSKYIHKPWEYQNSSDFKIGKDYPAPIVNHEEARARALEAFKKLK